MRIALALLAAVLFLQATNDCSASGNPPSPSCHSCGRKVCCPEVKVKKETRHCWEVECKEVCIPAVRFPWMDCGQFLCGRVRKVNVLVEKDYEVDKCEYKWKILCKHCGGTAQPCEK